MVNQGKATEAEADAERRREGELEPAREPVPMFVRTKRFQIHVGPLPEGEDVEGGGKYPTGRSSGRIGNKKTVVMAPAASNYRTGSGSFHVDIGLEVRPTEDSAG